MNQGSIKLTHMRMGSPPPQISQVKGTHHRKISVSNDMSLDKENEQNFSNFVGLSSNTPQQLRDLLNYPSSNEKRRHKNLMDFNQSLAKIADNRTSVRSNSDISNMIIKSNPQLLLDPRMKVKVSPGLKDLAHCKNLINRLNEEKNTPSSFKKIITNRNLQQLVNNPQPSVNYSLQSKFDKHKVLERNKEKSHDTEVLTSFGSSTTDCYDALTSKNPSQSQEFFRNVVLKGNGSNGTPLGASGADSCFKAHGFKMKSHANTGNVEVSTESSEYLASDKLGPNNAANVPHGDMEVNSVRNKQKKNFLKHHVKANSFTSELLQIKEDMKMRRENYIAQRNFIKEKHKDSILNLDVASVLSSDSKTSLFGENSAVFQSRSKGQISLNTSLKNGLNVGQFNHQNTATAEQKNNSINDEDGDKNASERLENAETNGFIDTSLRNTGHFYCSAKAKELMDLSMNHHDTDKVNTRNSNSFRRPGHHRYKSCIDLDSSDVIAGKGNCCSNEKCNIF